MLSIFYKLFTKPFFFVIKKIKVYFALKLHSPLQLPSFKNFRGTIEKLDDFRFVVNGEVSIVDDQTIEITELPIRSWTQAYKETVLEPMLMGTDKQPALIKWALPVLAIGSKKVASTLISRSRKSCVLIIGHKWVLTIYANNCATFNVVT